MRKYKDMEEQFKANQMMMAEMEKTFEQKLAEAKAKEKEVNRCFQLIFNLNEFRKKKSTNRNHI